MKKQPFTSNTTPEALAMDRLAAIAIFICALVAILAG